MPGAMDWSILDDECLLGGKASSHDRDRLRSKRGWMASTDVVLDKGHCEGLACLRCLRTWFTCSLNEGGVQLYKNCLSQQNRRHMRHWSPTQGGLRRGEALR
jgi:hypothetical protein